ncbi:MAG: protein kinase domain-containing protein [Prochlorothrix sp.]
MTAIVPGTLIASRYHITQVLGQGGFGRTYLAEDRNRFDEACVLKEFAPQVQGPDALKKAQDLFQREAGVLYRLSHPQIPCFRELLRTKIHDRDYLLLVQDYIEGCTYRELLTDRQSQGTRFVEAEVRQILECLLPVLAYIHRNGVIHRDISPDNLMWRQADQLPVLIDLGGVKQAAVSVMSAYQAEEDTAGFPRSEALTRLGKVGYAPPEQMQQGSVYPHSDLYALAVTMLVLLTGQEPQALLDPHTLEWRWREWVVVQPDFGAVLDQMLELRPSDRYPNAETVLQALTGSVSPLTPTPTTPASPVSPPQPVPTSPSPPRPPRPAPPVTHATVVAVGQPPPQAGPAPSPAPASQATRTEPTARRVASDRVAPPKQTQKRSRSGRGAGGSLFLLAVLFLVAGFGGWGAVRLLQSLSNDNGGSREPSPTPQVATTLSPAEQQRKDALDRRRRQLNINDRFLISLVDQFFFLRYPNLANQPLTLDPEDAPYRESWDNLAQTWLDRLERLEENRRSRLGQYRDQDFDQWVREVNGRFVSSRALVELVNVAFRDRFPEVDLANTPRGPIDQIWWALGETVRDDLLGGKTLQELEIEAGQTEVSDRGQVQPGQGRVLLAFLGEGQTLTLDFETTNSLALGLYPPNTSQDPLLTVQPGPRSWSTTLADTGYYELILLPQGETASPYRLTLRVESPAPDPNSTASPTASPMATPTLAPTVAPVPSSPSTPRLTPTPVPPPSPDPDSPASSSPQPGLNAVPAD